MPMPLIIVFTVFLIGAWFFLGESQSWAEKVFVIFAVIFIYVAYRLMSGDSLYKIFSPLFSP